jgi:hypothetical protein
MAGKGRRFVFHGTFKSKRAAVAHESKRGEFVIPVHEHGKRLYSLVTARKRK